uniref:Protein kinase domain-containing protein n=1 Tax=Kalanchoe fedtschenkoi TaxID=63787 RepID=A0A7N0TZK3_KALFE
MLLLSGTRVTGRGKRMAVAVLVAVVAAACVLAPAIAATDQTDVQALNVMFTSMNSPSQLTKWTASSGDPCGDSWLGVKCSGSRVTEIKLPGFGLSGSLGYQLGTLTSLTYLDISHNNFGNQMPYNLPPNLQHLNLGNNGFQGTLQYSIYSMTSLKYLVASHNQLSGQLTDVFSNLSYLSTLDLSYNAFSGELPQGFSHLSSMTTLLLQNNMFTGTINVLANLPLETLRPTHPDDEKSPSGGGGKSGIGGGGVAGIVISVLVVGAVVAFFLVKRRRSRQSSSDEEKLDNRPFKSFNGSNTHEMNFIHNSTAPEVKTYEIPAAASLKPPPVEPGKPFFEDSVVAKPTVTKKARSFKINLPSYSIADLQMSTGSFNVDNLVGEGSFGRVYRAQFDDGKVMAVKKIDSSLIRNPDDFLEMVSSLSKLHHPNVTELVGYCSEYGQHLLVFEFHKNGSLHDFLHLSDEYSTTPLTWNTRVKVALGTASALEYLHERCSSPIIHKSFKSDNILLDSELNPRLTACGLASSIPDADQVLSQDLGSGYAAPEVAMSSQYSMKSDVYTFGVVMLELLTGRKPFDSSRPRAEQSLVRWATPQLHDIDALAKMADPELNGLYSVKALSRFADVIALCVQPEPEFRPPMSEVVESLVRLLQRTNMSKRTTGRED